MSMGRQYGAQIEAKLSAMASISVGMPIDLIDHFFEDGKIIGQFKAGGRMFRFEVTSRSFGYQRSSAPIRKVTSLDDRDLYQTAAQIMAAGRRIQKKRNNDAADCRGRTSIACGESCISDRKKCLIDDPKIKQLASETISLARRDPRNGPVPKSPAAVKTLQNVEDRIRYNDYESAAVVDPETGEMTLFKKGGKYEVGFTSEEISKMKGKVLTHNHPAHHQCPSHPCDQGLSFSVGDIAMASNAQLSEIRAVSKGYEHSISPGPGGWDRQKLERQYNRSIREAANKEVRNGYKYMLQGVKTPEEATIDAQHKVWRDVAKKHGLKYERIPITDEARRDNERFNRMHPEESTGQRSRERRIGRRAA